MFTINFLFKNSPNFISLTFKERVGAREKFDFANKNVGVSLKNEFSDDYGMTAAVDMAQISAVTFSEYSKEMDRNGEAQIIQAKATLKTQKLAQNDIGLQVLSKGINGVQQ